MNVIKESVLFDQNSGMGQLENRLTSLKGALNV